MTQDTLSLADLAVEEPRLMPAAPLKEDSNFIGACHLGDGDVDGWLVVVEPAKGDFTRADVNSVSSAAGIVWLGAKVPAGIISEAHKVGLAVLSARGGLSATDIFAAVGRLHRRAPNLRTWRKLTASEKLSSALLSSSPEAELLRRYAALTGEALALFTIDGRVHSAAGQLPARSIARQLRGLDEDTLTFSLGRWKMYATYIYHSEADRAAAQGLWLVRGTRTSAPPDPHEPAAAALEDLILVVTESRRTIARDELADASVLLRAFVRPEADQDVVSEGLLRRGFAAGSRVHLLVAGRAGEGLNPGVYEAPAAVAAHASVPILVGHVGGVINVLTTHNHAVDAIARELPSPVGISAPVDQLTGGRHAWRQARVAQLVAGRDSRLSNVSTHFEQCSAAEQAAAMLDSVSLAACVRDLDQAISEVKGAEELVEAMVRHNYSPSATASALGVHSNTVRNRLSQIKNRTRAGAADFELWHLWRSLEQGL